MGPGTRATVGLHTLDPAPATRRYRHGAVDQCPARTGRVWRRRTAELPDPDHRYRTTRHDPRRTGIGTRAGGRARHWCHPGFADRSHRTWTRTPRAYGPRHAAPADTLATRLDGTILALALHHHYRRGARRAAVDYRQRL